MVWLYFLKSAAAALKILETKVCRLPSIESMYFIPALVVFYALSKTYGVRPAV